MSATALVIERGRVYRAKKPRPAPGPGVGCVNDRLVRYLGTLPGHGTEVMVQYDGPAVAVGRHLPCVTLAKFTAWAARDVTEELPANGDWAEWKTGTK